MMNIKIATKLLRSIKILELKDIYFIKHLKSDPSRYHINKQDRGKLFFFFFIAYKQFRKPLVIF